MQIQERSGARREQIPTAGKRAVSKVSGVSGALETIIR